MVVMDEYCPECGGKLKWFTLQDPMSFAYKAVTKLVCTNCGKTVKEIESDLTSTETNSTINMIDLKCPVCGDSLTVDKTTGEKSCKSCGYIESLLPHKSNIESDSTSNATYPEKENVGGLYGWICPKCGAVMSPYQSFCPNCTHHDWQITYSTNSTSGTASQHELNTYNSKFMQTVEALNRGELPPLDYSDEGLHTHKNGWT